MKNVGAAQDPYERASDEFSSNFVDEFYSNGRSNRLMKNSSGSLKLWVSCEQRSYGQQSFHTNALKLPRSAQKPPISTSFLVISLKPWNRFRRHEIKPFLTEWQTDFKLDAILGFLEFIRHFEKLDSKKVRFEDVEGNVSSKKSVILNERLGTVFSLSCNSFSRCTRKTKIFTESSKYHRLISLN